jgi:hypothetical protein
MNKCLKERGGQAVFPCEQVKQLVDRTVILSRFPTVSTDVRKAVCSCAAAKKTLKTAVKKILKPISRKSVAFV